jgi:hypothetical protein
MLCQFVEETTDMSIKNKWNYCKADLFHEPRWRNIGFG